MAKEMQERWEEIQREFDRGDQEVRLMLLVMAVLSFLVAGLAVVGALLEWL